MTAGVEETTGVEATAGVEALAIGSDDPRAKGVVEPAATAGVAAVDGGAGAATVAGPDRADGWLG